MNKLSWFLYLAEVIPNLAVVGVTCVTIGGLLLLLLPKKGCGEFMSGGHAPFDGITRVMPYVLLTIGLALITLVPSKDTIYLIAGSEAGEYVVTTPEGQEIVDDIKVIIQQQIKNLKE
jgi:hypothetical protein